MIHYWYSESKRTACHMKAIGGDGIFGPGAYEAVDCEPCRRALRWPDPVEFPNLSTHPNHITNRGYTVDDSPETIESNRKDFGMSHPEILD